MANEAIKIETQGVIPIRYTIPNGMAVEQGTLMVLSGAGVRTIFKSQGVGDAFAGIAASEKVASDGSTTLSCYRGGIWDLTASGPINCGAMCIISGTNLIARAPDLPTISGATIVGIALETASDGEVIAVQVGA